MAEAIADIDPEVALEERVALPLVTEVCPVNETCLGERWTTLDVEQLGKIIAIIAMGQAAQAAHILSELESATPAFTSDELKSEARITLTVQEKTQTPRTGYPRYQRDGFIFEAISWIAAQQSQGDFTYMKDPHVSSTSQGLDGLMIQLSSDKNSVEEVTVFEDKCTDDPINTFNHKVIPAFIARHKNKRSAEIIATASVLLKIAGISNKVAAKLSAAVTDRTRRRYRAAFSVGSNHDSEQGRRAIFGRYNEIDGVNREQRIGACFVVPIEMRDWFDYIAFEAIKYIDEFKEDEINV